MSATVIDPAAMPVVFEGWHKDGSDVTLHAIQVVSAYRLLPLAVKGMKFGRGTSPVRFLNQAFGCKLPAHVWQARLAPVIDQIHAA
jgi:hypothetical protein